MENERYQIINRGQQQLSEYSKNILMENYPGIIKQKIWLHGGEIDGEMFLNRNLKRSYAENVIFSKCDFSEAAATGVIWRNNQFLNCIFKKADFEFADLTGSVIECSTNPKKDSVVEYCIDGSGFNGSVMRDVNLLNTTIKGSSFAQTDFTGSNFENCTIQSTTFEDCVFSNSILLNINLCNTNIEYADFRDASFSNVAISIEQLPFLFGITLDVLEKQNVLISNWSKSHKIDLILKISDLKRIKKALIEYYNSYAIYFAGASLYYLFKEQNRFVKQIKEGIRHAVMFEDYRSLKHICKLAGQSYQERGVFAKSDLIDLYDKILNWVGSSPNRAAYTQYKLHDGLIRSYLVGNQKKRSLDIIFRTVSPDPNNVHHAIFNIAAHLIDGCKQAGIIIEILNISSSVNSNPLIQITIGNIKVDLTFFKKGSEGKNNYSDKQADNQKGKSPWNSYSKYAAVVATISMLFSGANIYLKVNKAKMPTMNPSTQIILIEKHYSVINQYIQNETFLIRDDIKNIVYSDGGKIKIDINNSPGSMRTSNNGKDG